jgi:hypothetical protein
MAGRTRSPNSGARRQSRSPRPAKIAVPIQSVQCRVVSAFTSASEPPRVLPDPWMAASDSGAGARLRHSSAVKTERPLRNDCARCWPTWRQLDATGLEEYSCRPTSLATAIDSANSAYDVLCFAGPPAQVQSIASSQTSPIAYRGNWGRSVVLHTVHTTQIERTAVSSMGTRLTALLTLTDRLDPTGDKRESMARCLAGI